MKLYGKAELISRDFKGPKIRPCEKYFRIEATLQILWGAEVEDIIVPFTVLVFHQLNNYTCSSTSASRSTERTEEVNKVLFSVVQISEGSTKKQRKRNVETLFFIKECC